MASARLVSTLSVSSSIQLTVILACFTPGSAAFIASVCSILRGALKRGCGAISESASMGENSLKTPSSSSRRFSGSSSP